VLLPACALLGLTAAQGAAAAAPRQKDPSSYPAGVSRPLSGARAPRYAAAATQSSSQAHNKQKKAMRA